MTFGPRVCSTTSPATVTPWTVGPPSSVPLSFVNISTSPKVTLSPGAASSLAIVMTSLAATRYCLQPVLITATIVLPRVHAGLSASGSRGRLLGSFGFGTRLLPPQTQARGRGPAREGGEISRQRPPVNVATMSDDDAVEPR